MAAAHNLKSTSMQPRHPDFFPPRPLRRRPELLIALLAASMLALPARAQTPRPEFGIRETGPRLGASTREYVVHGSQVPINRKYHELTPEQKALLNQLYEDMKSGDEPPFPAEGLFPIYDALRKAQGKLGVTGDLILVVDVDATGQPTAVKTIGSPSPEMTKFAASLLLITRFKPAVCGGQPCAMQYPFGLDFRLR
jgi:hypothetical protein